MSNQTSNLTISNGNKQDLIVTYYSLGLIIFGTLFNLFTLSILCRPTFRDTQRRPTIHYMRVIAIFDILMLYGWNLDHFLSGAYGYTLLRYSIAFCKICSFWNYFTAQVSAWLRVFICLDRYLSMSRLYKTWFSQSKNVLIIISCIIIVFFIINGHFFIFACYYNKNGTLNPQALLYDIYPIWDYMNLALYNCSPFILMVIFNSGVIYHLFLLRQSSKVHNSRIRHHAISVTLVITTFLFLLMTIPATILFAFFSQKTSYFILHFFDSVLFTYHILAFFIYLITFPEFRQETIKLVTCNKWPNIQSSLNSTASVASPVKPSVTYQKSINGI